MGLASGSFLFFSGSGCSPSRLTHSPYDASCEPLLEFPCEAGPPEAVGCPGNPAAIGVLERQIPANASYPVGCTVIIPHPVKDEMGECIFEGSCNCQAKDGGAIAWKCTL
jgi:hypothetical protein